MSNRLTNHLKTEWLQLLLLVLPLLAVLIAMPHAAERIPMQWGLDGRVTWTAPKEWGLLVLPGITLLVITMVMAFERVDPARFRDDGTLSAHARASRLIRLSISLLLGVVCLVQIAASIGRDISLSGHVPTMVALFIAVFGNVLGKLKPNRYVGFRLPWTMASEDVWRATHRFAGALFVTTGLLVASLSWLMPGQLPAAAGIIWATALFGMPVVFAWWAARRHAR